MTATIGWTIENNTLIVAWGAIADLLGHAHRGLADDDLAVLAALRASGAPSWTDRAEGIALEEGWGLLPDDADWRISDNKVADDPGSGHDHVAVKRPRPSFGSKPSISRAVSSSGSKIALLDQSCP